MPKRLKKNLGRGQVSEGEALTLEEFARLSDILSESRHEQG